MSETPTENTEPNTPDDDNIPAGEARRALGIQLAANLVSQRQEGIGEMLDYASSIESFLENGTKPEVPEQFGPTNPR